MVKAAVKTAIEEARKHVEMLQATGKYPEAILVAQKIASFGQCFPLPENPTIADLQKLADLSEKQEDFVAAEHYWERLLRLTISSDPWSGGTEQAIEKLSRLYQRSERKLAYLMKIWRLNVAAGSHISSGFHRSIRLNNKTANI
jgi:hypothetical protein